MTSNPGAEPSSESSQTSTSVETNPAETVVNDANSAKTTDTQEVSKETVNPPTNGKSDLTPLPERPTVDDLLSRITPEEAVKLTKSEIDDFLAGKPDAVARILKLPPAESTVTTPSSTAPKEPAVQKQPEDDQGVERISLRGLSAKDQVALAKAVKAVKDGKYSTLEEARIALSAGTTEQSDNASHQDDTQATDDDEQPPVALTSTPKIEELQKTIADGEIALLQAQKAYNQGEIARLTRAITRAEIQLDTEKERLEATNKDTLRQYEQSKVEKTQWIADQQVHIDAITTANPDLADSKSALNRAFKKEQVFAQTENDPIFDSADWPLEILKRAKEALGAGQPPSLPKPPAQQQRQPLGVLEQPTNNGPAMSVDEAMDEIDRIPEGPEREAFIDKILSGIRERERADAQFGGRRR